MGVSSSNKPSRRVSDGSKGTIGRPFTFAKWDAAHLTRGAWLSRSVLAEDVNEDATPQRT